MTGDWVLVDQSCNGIKRRQWSSNNGEPYYQFWRTLTNEERWACPKQTVTPRRTQLIKIMQEYLLDMGYYLGKTGADGIAGTNTCKAAYVEQFKQGICGKDVLQPSFFEAMGFTKAEVADAMTYVSGVCRGYYTNEYACANPNPPKEPVKPPVTPPAQPPACAGPTLPANMAWCSGQPAGATLLTKAVSVPACAGWTKEVWKTTDGAQHIKFNNATKKLTKWACAKAAPITTPPDVQPGTEKAGWAWWLAGGIILAAAGTFYFNKPRGGKGRRR